MLIENLVPDSEETQRLNVPLDSGQGQLEWKVSHSWRRFLWHTIGCGQRFEHRYEKHIGITKEDYESLNSEASVTIGLKGIAEFCTKLSAACQQKISFSVGTKETLTHSFEAPANGIYNIRIFQKHRLHHFKFESPERFRFWKNKTTEFFVDEALDHFDDRSRRFPEHPRCGCAPADSDGEIVIELTPNVRMTVNIALNGQGIQCNELDGYNLLLDLEELKNRSGKVSTSPDFFVNDFRKPVEVDVPDEVIPDHLLDICGREKVATPVNVIGVRWPAAGIQDQIRKTANDLWQAGGSQRDLSLDYWLKAERQFVEAMMGLRQ